MVHRILAKNVMLFNKKDVMLFNPNGLCFANVYVIPQSLYQPNLQWICTLPNPTDDLKSNSVMIFDDMVCEKQKNICNYFTMGRHKNVDVFYLRRVPKQLIRDIIN